MSESIVIEHQIKSCIYTEISNLVKRQMVDGDVLRLAWNPGARKCVYHSSAGFSHSNDDCLGSKYVIALKKGDISVRFGAIKTDLDIKIVLAVLVRQD